MFRFFFFLNNTTQEGSNTLKFSEFEILQIINNFFMQFYFLSISLDLSAKFTLLQNSLVEINLFKYCAEPDEMNLFSFN